MTTPNKSLNKVRVSDLLGTDSTVGLTEPVVGMQVRHGIDNRYIRSLDTDHGQVGLSKVNSGNYTEKAYPHELEITFVTASGSYGFPYNDTDVVFGHASDPTGVPTSPKSFVICQGGVPTSYTYGN